MKQIAVSKIPYGETFRVFGDTFIALDRVDGGVLAIRRDVWKNAPFDEDGKNDFRRASIRNDLSDYLIELFGNGANYESIIKATVDLKATDGTREYGFFKIFVALLTLEQYGKYQHIIPDVDNEWWLATPHMTPRQKNGNTIFAWCVSKYGIGVGHCQHDNGIRPALVFAPSLLVEYDDGDAEPDGTVEKALYERYMDYVAGWADYNEYVAAHGLINQREIGESPMNYETWKAWDESNE